MTRDEPEMNATNRNPLRTAREAPYQAKYGRAKEFQYFAGRPHMDGTEWNAFLEQNGCIDDAGDYAAPGFAWPRMPVM